MFAIPNCSRSMGIQVLLAITYGIAEFPVHGHTIPANEVCLNVSNEIICYFKGSINTTNWTVATNICRSFDSTLLVIRNENDQIAVAGYLKSHLNNAETWTAGKNFTYSTWKWINGKSLKDPVKENEYPYAKKDNGALESDFTFTARAASEELPYICQHEAGNCKFSSDVNVNKKCLRLINESRSWYDARNQCLMTKGDLAVIGEAELEYLKSLKLNESYWIGLRRQSFRWTLDNDVESNDEIRYTSWDSHTFATEGDCISTIPSEGNWRAFGCNQLKTVVCQRGQGVTFPAGTTDTSAETMDTSTLFAVVGVGIIIVICIIVIVVFVLRTKNRRSGQSKLNDGYVKTNGDELNTRISNAPVYTSINEPVDNTVNRSDDMRGVYADIALLTSDQSEDGRTDQQPGTVYVSLDFNEDPTNVEPDKTISHPTFPTKVGPLGDIYAIPDARGHAVTSPGDGSASHPVNVTSQGDVYAIPMKMSTSPTTSPPTGAVYANLRAATLDKEQMAEDNSETK